MLANSLLPDPRDEAEIERLEGLLSSLRETVSAVAHRLRREGNALPAVALELAILTSDPSRKET